MVRHDDHYLSEGAELGEAELWHERLNMRGAGLPSDASGRNTLSLAERSQRLSLSRRDWMYCSMSSSGRHICFSCSAKKLSKSSMLLISYECVEDACESGENACVA